MAPNSNLHGLNIVQPAESSSERAPNLDSLLYPGADSAAEQFSLWSNLHFDGDDFDARKRMGTDHTEGKRAAQAVHDAHMTPQTPSFDLQALFAANLSQTSNPTLSLAQLIQFAQVQTQNSAPPRNPTISLPEAKRARTSSAPTFSPANSPPNTASTSASSSSITPVDEKRRRNTAASARFRAKKKEREAALEEKAKILETRVGELERECEGLRRENGWLRGLVVGVVGTAVEPETSVMSSGKTAGAGVKRGREGD
ncbi:hypothetical protein BDZ89DRAFT_83005 [Hymenopellis radicata]|nr:hypothetical protein BDZ89DRAFT_83005 [Hymenopellis radicata]